MARNEVEASAAATLVVLLQQAYAYALAFVVDERTPPQRGLDSLKLRGSPDVVMEDIGTPALAGSGTLKESE